MLLAVALLACLIAWTLMLIGVGTSNLSLVETNQQWGMLVCATLLILAYGSRIWPNLVPITGLLLLLGMCGLLGLLMISEFVVAVF